MATLINKTYDVAVIGAGVFGSWTAYLLAQTGRRVLLVDAYGPANARSSSSGESRIIRAAYGDNALYTQFAARSLDAWRQLSEESVQPCFLRTGVLWVAAEQSERLQAAVRTLRQFRVPAEELDQTEIRRRYPQFQFPSDVAAIFEPESGALLPRSAVPMVVSRARQEGVELCRELIRRREGPHEFVAESGTRISAGTFLFACGAWLPKLFPDVLRDVIFPTRQELFYFGVPSGEQFLSPRLPIWIDDTEDSIPYGFPDLEGSGVKLAFHRKGPAFDPDSDDRQVSSGAVQEAKQYIQTRFPLLVNAPLVQAQVCPYENTNTGDFLIDQHPEYGNLWFIGGGSGHGFKHGPAVAEYVLGRLDSRIPAEHRFSLQANRSAQTRVVV